MRYKIPFLLLIMTVYLSVNAQNYNYGVNLAGAEFGENVPGTFGSDYVYPNAEELDYYQSKGLNLIRLPFLWERLQPTLSGPLDAIELGRITDVIHLIQDRDMQVLIDLHNYGRYKLNGDFKIIGSPELSIDNIKDLWTKLADELKNESHIWGYGIMNEPHDMLEATPWLDIAQEIINGVRSVDSITTIVVGGDSWSSADRWLEESDNLKNLIDDNLIFEAHVYFDNDASGQYLGTYDQEGATPNIGVDRATPFIEWLQENNLRGFMGEYGIPDNDVRWLTTLDNFMTYLRDHCINGTYWAGGPWWGDNFMTIEPYGDDNESDPVNGPDRPQMTIVGNYTTACNGHIYYVSLDGDNNDDGLSTTTSWRTIGYAASSQSPVSPGDTVYVKAGDYGNELVNFDTDGIAGKPIVFIGYQTIPGDNPTLDWQVGDVFDPMIMPLLDGVNRWEGVGMELHSRYYINIQNFQIQNYEYGVFGWNAQHIIIDNIFAKHFGSVDSVYQGVGILFGSLANYNSVNNCTVYNSCAEGLSIVGNYNIVSNCNVYADDNSTGNKSAMDYYIHISGNENTVQNCYVERFNNIEHAGHSIGLKGDCENNIVRNCTAKGFEYYGFNVRGAGVKNNLFENCEAIDCGYTVREGASNNLFKNCTADGAQYAIMFWDTNNDNSPDDAGYDNVFENCKFTNTIDEVITFHYYSRPSNCHDNTFANCIFDGGNYLFLCDRENNNNKMVNCIVTNVEHYYRTQVYQSIAYPINFNFEYTNFFSNGFPVPTGTNVTTHNPLYVDPTNGDYHLDAASACIDIGTSVGVPMQDFEGVDRPQGAGYDLGVYEYQPALALEDEQKLWGELISNEIELTWYFNDLEITDAIIERSTDQSIWHEIATIELKNISKLTYIDKSAPLGTIYYRIKYIDIDHQFIFSNIVTLENSLTNVSIFPNPVKNELHFTLNNNLNNNLNLKKTMQVSIYTLDGKLIKSQRIESNETINVSAMGEGVYIAEILWGSITQSIKFVVMD